MKYAWHITTLLFLLGLFSCETEFTPDVSIYEEQIVVEGHIEAGDRPTPPYVLLTKNQAFFSEINSTSFDDLFIHDAVVTVENSQNTITLQEICFNDLSEEQQQIFSDFLGLGDTDSININFCVYTDLSFSMMGEIGETYHLNIQVDGKELSAVTTIPEHIPIESLNFSPIPDPDNDTLQELTGSITDPTGEKNFYRYFTQVDNEPLIPGFTSVSDDIIFDGSSFEFPIPKGQPRTEEIDPNTYGYFLEGTTATIKWCNIDEAHFDFWNTLEFNMANQGPFSSYTKISSNINGGLGIWGGYSATYYTEIVPFD